MLDVGTGSGILAIWSAQAGARKVYAVEATKMSEHARELVKANNLQDIVEVIEGSVEDVTLPEKGSPINLITCDILTKHYQPPIMFYMLCNIWIVCIFVILNLTLESDWWQLMSLYQNGWDIFFCVNLCLIQ